ncbi:hypothetical protein [Acinetobacter terrestris]|uniref:hypothetical protein n=1 Tax=Acinetobacter terrestris TaxID=2529843 RepID=UPI001BE3E93D|nr:hypothetical protein [Acinetobacter terrestris]
MLEEKNKCKKAERKKREKFPKPAKKVSSSLKPGFYSSCRRACLKAVLRPSSRVGW